VPCRVDASRRRECEHHGAVVRAHERRVGTTVRPTANNLDGRDTVNVIPRHEKVIQPHPLCVRACVNQRANNTWTASESETQAVWARTRV
jgi:hypothetical protein